MYLKGMPVFGVKQTDNNRLKITISPTPSTCIPTCTFLFFLFSKLICHKGFLLKLQ